MGCDVNSDKTIFGDSECRLETATQKLDERADDSVESMQRILLDRSVSKQPIHRGYVPDDVLGKIGTVCTVIMKLKERRLLIKKGNGAISPFQEYGLI